MELNIVRENGVECLHAAHSALMEDPAVSGWHIEAAFDPNIEPGQIYKHLRLHELRDEAALSWKRNNKTPIDIADIYAMDKRQGRNTAAHVDGPVIRGLYRVTTISARLSGSSEWHFGTPIPLLDMNNPSLSIKEFERHYLKVKESANCLGDDELGVSITQRPGDIVVVKTLPSAVPHKVKNSTDPTGSQCFDLTAQFPIMPSQPADF